MSTTEAWTELPPRFFLIEYIPLYRSPSHTRDRIKHPQTAMSIYANMPWSGSDNLTPLWIGEKGIGAAPHRLKSVLDSRRKLFLLLPQMASINMYWWVHEWRVSGCPCIYLIKRHFRWGINAKWVYWGLECGSSVRKGSKRGWLKKGRNKVIYHWKTEKAKANMYLKIHSWSFNLSEFFFPLAISIFISFCSYFYSGSARWCGIFRIKTPVSILQDNWPNNVRLPGLLTKYKSGKQRIQKLPSLTTFCLLDVRLYKVFVVTVWYWFPDVIPNPNLGKCSTNMRSMCLELMKQQMMKLVV